MFAPGGPVAASEEEVGKTPEEGEEGERNIPGHNTHAIERKNIRRYPGNLDVRCLQEEARNNEPDDKEETNCIPLDGTLAVERVNPENKKAGGIRNPESSVKGEDYLLLT